MTIGNISPLSMVAETSEYNLDQPVVAEKEKEGCTRMMPVVDLKFLASQRMTHMG